MVSIATPGWWVGEMEYQMFLGFAISVSVSGAQLFVVRGCGFSFFVRPVQQYVLEQYSSGFPEDLGLGWGCS